MEPLRAATPSTLALLRRRQSTPLLLLRPPNPLAAASCTSGSVLCRRLLSHASPRSMSSLAVEDVLGSDPDACAPEAAGGGKREERRSGLSSLRYLFAQPATSSSPKSTVKDGGVGLGGVQSRFEEKRTRTRLVKSADSGVSVGSGRAGDVLPEMTSLIRRLQEEGYLRNASFSQEVDACRVVGNGYARGVLMATAQRFGEDHQEIAKWLSGSSLKKVALSGCPCMERKTVFAAKRLRSFFSIQEDVVCRGCVMRKSCKFVNRSINRVDKLILADVMRVLTAYAWDCNLNLQKELKHSVIKSLKEVINLSS